MTLSVCPWQRLLVWLRLAYRHENVCKIVGSSLFSCIMFGATGRQQTAVSEQLCQATNQTTVKMLFDKFVISKAQVSATSLCMEVPWHHRAMTEE